MKYKSIILFFVFIIVMHLILKEVIVLKKQNFQLNEKFTNSNNVSLKDELEEDMFLASKKMAKKTSPEETIDFDIDDIDDDFFKELRTTTDKPKTASTTDYAAYTTNNILGGVASDYADISTAFNVKF